MDWSRKRYESLDKGYEGSLRWVLGHRRLFITGILLLFAASLALVPKIGTEFLPVSDESQFRIVLRGPVGQRVEKTEQQVAEVERVLRAEIPAEELETMVSSTGVLAQGRSSLFNPNTGPHTSVISVYLVSPDKRKRNQVQIMNDVRPKVLKLFPGVAMFFDPGGLVKRVTSFGSQKSVDVEIYGYDFEKARGRHPGGRNGRCTKYRAWPTSKSAARRTIPRSTWWWIARRPLSWGSAKRTWRMPCSSHSTATAKPTPSSTPTPKTGTSTTSAPGSQKNTARISRTSRTSFLTARTGEPVLLKNVASLKLNAGPVKIDRKYFQRVVH